MNEPIPSALAGPVVEDEVRLTLVELCRVCGASEELVRAWVVEGVLDPLGAAPHEWHFAGAALRRTRVAVRLSHDFDLNAAGVALALDLLDEIAALRARLERIGLR